MVTCLAEVSEGLREFGLGWVPGRGSGLGGKGNCSGKGPIHNDKWFLSHVVSRADNESVKVNVNTGKIGSSSLGHRALFYKSN